jgi:hypothetical protein
MKETAGSTHACERQKMQGHWEVMRGVSPILATSAPLIGTGGAQKSYEAAFAFGGIS